MGVSGYGVETGLTPVSGERITAETRLAEERMRARGGNREGHKNLGINSIFRAPL